VELGFKKRVGVRVKERVELGLRRVWLVRVKKRRGSKFLK
jgi:hypothetical protein